MSIWAAAALALLLALAYIAGRLTRQHLPELIGYLVIGAILGPSGVKILSAASFQQLHPVTLLAMGLLLFGIGENLSLGDFRTIRWLRLVAPFIYVSSGAAVFLAVRWAGASDAVAVVLAVVAGGGAPMTVASIATQLKADTSYARNLIALHAACDVLTAATFAALLPLAVLLSGPGVSLADSVATFVRLGPAGIALGVVLAVSLCKLVKRIGSRRLRALLALSHAVAAAVISIAFGLSVPLAALSLGAITASTSRREIATQLFAPCRRLEPLLFLFFFTLAGASIRLGALGMVGLIGVAYICARTVARVSGALVSGSLTSLPSQVTRGLAVGSIPQAGISVSLVAIASATLPGRGIATVTVGSIVLLELVGAVLVRWQLSGGTSRAAKSVAVSGPA